MSPGSTGALEHPEHRFKGYVGWAALACGLIGWLRYAAILLRYNAYEIARFFTADDAFYYLQTARATCRC